MEQAMRKGSKSEPAGRSRDTNWPSIDSYSDLPEELRDFPPSEEVILNLVDVYFRFLGNLSFNFLHEGVFRSRLQENMIPKQLLYAVCATSVK